MGTQVARASQQQLSGSLEGPTTALSRARAALQPCGQKTGTAELLACLTLVAPSGMSTQDRATWVAVARDTLSGIPADLLRYGCLKARERCKFASEIVPTILEETKASWAARKRRLAEEEAAEANRNAPRLEAPDYPAVPHEETQRILREVRDQFPTMREGGE